MDDYLGRQRRLDRMQGLQTDAAEMTPTEITRIRALAEKAV